MVGRGSAATADELGAQANEPGGLLGKVVKVSDNYISVEIADNTTINVQKQAISNLLPKGTIKNA